MCHPQTHHLGQERPENHNRKSFQPMKQKQKREYYTSFLVVIRPCFENALKPSFFFIIFFRIQLIFLAHFGSNVCTLWTTLKKIK